jgi:hypothetical protein
MQLSSFSHTSTINTTIGLSFLFAVLSISPAHSVGFLDINNGWSGSPVCVDSSSIGCVENIQSASVTLIGFDAPFSQIHYVSQDVHPFDPGYTSISFSYAFDPLPNQSAFYTFAGTSIPLDSTGGVLSSIAVQGILSPGESVGFGVANASNSFPAVLEISNFNYVSVPTPLPLLGFGTAFGWIRRLKAAQRAQRIKPIIGTPRHP